MQLHILLPTHNRPKLLQRCLESLESMADELTETTVHVIENGSAVSEGLASDYLSRLPICYHHFTQGNKSLALNAVIETLPQDSFFIFFDDDVAVRPSTINAFTSAANHFGQGHYFGGVLYPDYDVLPAPEVCSHLPPSAKKVDFSEGKEYREFKSFQYFMGAVWACFAADIQKAGGFNGNFGPGATSGARGQETDAQLRLFQNGGKPVFVRDAAVDHYVSAKMVTSDYAVDRIFLASIHKGLEQPSMVQSFGLLAKLVYSTLLLPLAPSSVGHRYRIAKAAGYFHGLAKRGVAGK